MTRIVRLSTVSVSTLFATACSELFRSKGHHFEMFLAMFDGIKAKACKEKLNKGFKDVRANCFCAFLMRTQMHTPRHTRARAK